MPRDGSNIYSQPFPDVVEDTTIESTIYNGFTNDVAQDLNAPRPIVAGGTGATNAYDAMVALSGEIATQIVTNYDSFPFRAGSFYSATGATSAPTASSFAGICVHPNNDPGYLILEAWDVLAVSPSSRYIREKHAGVWSAWYLQAGSSADLDTRYVNTSGDTMTGPLRVDATHIMSNNGGTQGRYHFGASGTKYLDFDGSNFTFSGGTTLSVAGGIFCSGAANLSGGTTTTTLTASGVIASGSTVQATGYQCRNGSLGGFGANVFNIFHGTGQQLYIDNSNVGTFAYTSDYRTKKDVFNLQGMWDTVKALRPIKYTQAQFSPPSHTREYSLYEADDVERWGFVAHELQETLTPSAAAGVKDSPDTIQSLNPFTLIAALTRALQEAMARIEALEASG